MSSNSNHFVMWLISDSGGFWSTVMSMWLIVMRSTWTRRTRLRMRSRVIICWLLSISIRCNRSFIRKLWIHLDSSLVHVKRVRESKIILMTVLMVWVRSMDMKWAVQIIMFNNSRMASIVKKTTFSKTWRRNNTRIRINRSIFKMRA